MGKYAQLLLANEPTQSAPARGKYSSQLIGSDAPEEPKAEPKQGWLAWGKEAVQGKQDPNYQGVGSIRDDAFEMFSRESTALDQAATAGASDAQLADVVKRQLGDRYVETVKDANGYDVIRYRDKNGLVRNGYVNRPGLDTEDIVRGVRGALPYVVGGGAVGAAARTAPLAIQAMAQGAGAAATSAVGDAAQIPLGSEQGIEGGKLLAMGAAGAAGPLVSAGAGALWRRFVTVPGLYDKAAGKLTEKGAEVARRAGINPADIEGSIAENFAKSYARTGNAEAATVEAMAKASDGIPATMGQMTKRPDLLTREEQMRRNLYGDKARKTMETFDATQREAIKAQALGRPELPPSARAMIPAGQQPARTGIGANLNPQRSPGVVPDDTNPAVLGQSVREGMQGARQAARTAEGEAWEGVRGLAATPEAMKTLPDAINARLGDVVVDDAITPAAARMGRELEAFIAGEVPASSAGIIKGQATQSVDQMRRRLGTIAGSAATPEDRRAAGAVYDAYNDWIGEAAEKSLLAGDPAAAMKLVQARGFTKEVRELFEPKTAAGTRSPAALRLSKVMDEAKADSGESVIAGLLGSINSSTGSGQTGTTGALRNIKVILDRFGGEGGKRAWDDIRLAYWSRLNMAKTGEMLGPQAIATNIKNALQNQRSVLQTLYSPDELKQMRQYLNQIERVAYKPPNASGSGYVVAAALKESMISLLNAFGLGRAGVTALEYSGLPSAYGAAAARAAVNPKMRVINPNLTPLITSGTSVYQRQD